MIELKQIHGILSNKATFNLEVNDKIERITAVDCGLHNYSHMEYSIYHFNGNVERLNSNHMICVTEVPKEKVTS